MKWKVKYEHLENKMRRYPFWKLEDVVEADTRDAAVELVRSEFPPPRYGNYMASRARCPGD
jgi:hypothetical protein